MGLFPSQFFFFLWILNQFDPSAPPKKTVHHRLGVRARWSIGTGTITRILLVIRTWIPWDRWGQVISTSPFCLQNPLSSLYSLLANPNPKSRRLSVRVHPTPTLLGDGDRLYENPPPQPTILLAQVLGSYQEILSRCFFVGCNPASSSLLFVLPSSDKSVLGTICGGKSNNLRVLDNTWLFSVKSSMGNLLLSFALIKRGFYLWALRVPF